MWEQEIAQYKNLNALAERGGIVILGGSGDRQIPLCEIKQAFALEANLYNRSVDGLRAKDAAEFYDACVAALQPDTVLVHLGEADLDEFTQNPAAYALCLRELVHHIRSVTPGCCVAFISLCGAREDPRRAELNRHLKLLAQAEQCEFGDVAARRMCNVRELQDVASFVYSTGFVHPLKGRRPVYDLARILFGDWSVAV